MDIAELGGKLPWILGIVAVVWVLRRLSRTRSVHELPGLPPREAAPVRGVPDAVTAEEPDDDEGADEADEEDEEAEAELGTPAGADPSARPRGAPPASARGVGAVAAGLLVVAIAAGVLFLVAPLREGDERRVLYLAGMVVLLVGSGFLRLGLQRLVTVHRRRARAAHAAEPWLRDRDWSREGAAPIAEESLFPQALAVVFLGALVLPFHTIWAVPFSWWGFWVVIGILDLLIFAALLVALRTAWFRLVGGAATLRWSSAPVAPGGTFTADVEITRTVPADAPARITLRCMRDGSDGGSATEDPAPDASKIWSEERTFPIRPRPGGGATVDVSFAVPADAKGTDTRLSRPIRWQLVVVIPTAGPDFETIFAVPIYARE